MSIHTVSARLESENVKHIVVVAKSKFTTIESFAKSIKSPEASAYAKAYHTWVSKGRKGAPPKCEDANFKMLKYIRSVVSQLV
jgi:hypothetical protein